MENNNLVFYEWQYDAETDDYWKIEIDTETKLLYGFPDSGDDGKFTGDLKKIKENE
jgi:hypothetical protein